MEAKIQKKIIRLLEKNDAYVMKVSVSNKTGRLDLVACLNGVFVAIEVKDKNNIESGLQQWNKQLIKKAGGIAFPAWSVDDVISNLKTYGIDLLV